MSDGDIAGQKRIERGAAGRNRNQFHTPVGALVNPD
jgi:hypothetical protein